MRHLPGAYARDADEHAKRDLHVDFFEIVFLCAFDRQEFPIASPPSRGYRDFLCPFEIRTGRR
jgi:hypothetical protein